MDQTRTVKIKLDVKIPSNLAFAIILILSFIVALYTVNAAGKVIDNAKDSPSFNIQKRVETQAPDLNNR